MVNRCQLETPCSATASTTSASSTKTTCGSCGNSKIMSDDEDYNRNWCVLIFGLDCEKSPQVSEEKLYEGMGNSFELLRDLLLRVVERGAELSEDDIDHIIFH
jgi:hypothetical protein